MEDLDIPSHFVNVCGSCLKELGITHIGYTVKGPYVKMMNLLVDRCPKICNTCNFFICDECRELMDKCPEPCTGIFVTYTIF